MRVANTSTETVPIGDLKPHPDNPRRGNTKAIEESIKHNGFYGTIIAQRSTGRILAGNHRFQAAVATGATAVPVTWVEVDDDQALRILLADNRTNDLASYDDASLASILERLAEESGTLSGTGYGTEDLQELLTSLEEPPLATSSPEAQIDRAEELLEKWRVKPGQTWVAGPHKLYCGDSTDPASYSFLLQDERVDIVWTDPPWNVAYGENKNPRYRHRTIQNDNLGENFEKFLHQFLAAATPYAKDGAPAYVVMSAQEWPQIQSALSATGWHWSSTIIWAKDRLVLSRKDYHTQYEPIWYGWKEGAARLHQLQDRKQSDLWHIDRPHRSDEHPTMKPPELITRALQNSSKVGSIVLDPFTGSGSTIVAAAQTQRIGRGIELEPKYVAVTLERLADMGLTPETIE